MKARSEFQKILEEKLSGPKSRPESNFEEDSKFTSRKTSGSFSTTDFLNSIKYAFSQGPMRQQVFGDYGNHNTEKKPDADPKKKIYLDPLPRPAQKPQPRIKRVRSFDQNKAIQLFVKFGENSIDDCSTDDEIKVAYRRLAKKFHPDMVGTKNDESFKLISGAYKKLIS